MFNDVYNPIPKAVRDPDLVRDFFAKNNILPYSGTSGASSHGILNILFDLCALSPSKEAAVNFIKGYAFQGKVDLVEAAIPGLKLEADQSSISDNEKKKIAKELYKVGFQFDTISNMASRHNKDDRTCGNVYTILEEITIGSTKQIKLSYVHPTQCFYLDKKTSSLPDRMIIFKYGWDVADEAERKSDRVSNIHVYPNWTKTGNGRKTLFHMANLVDRNDLYGRPEDASSLIPQYVEYSNIDLAAKVSRKEIVTKFIIAFQQDIMNRDSVGNKQRAKATRKIMTSQRQSYWDPGTRSYVEGEDTSQTVAFIDYNGEKAPTPMKLEIMRDSKWFNTQADAQSNYILMANRIPKDLVGYESADSSLNSKSGEFILQQFKTVDLGVIRPIQERYADYWNKIIRVIGEFAGVKEMEDVGLKFPQRISQMIEETIEIDVKIDGRRSTVKQEGGQANTPA